MFAAWKLKSLKWGNDSINKIKILVLDWKKVFSNDKGLLIFKIWLGSICIKHFQQSAKEKQPVRKMCNGGNHEVDRRKMNIRKDV